MKKLLFISILFFSMNLNAQWAPTNCPGTEVPKIATYGNLLYAATGTGGGFHTSSDSGQTWTAPFTFPLGDFIQSVFYCDGYLFLGGSIGNYRSSDGGYTWSQMPTLVEETYSFLKFGSTIYAGTFGGGVYKSIDTGNTWISCNNGLFNGYILALTNDQNSLYAASPNGLFKSINNGQSWLDVTISIGSPNFDAVTYDGSYIIAGGNYCGIYRSADGGSTWNSANSGLSSTDIRSLYTVGETVFLGGANGVKYSIDHGATWVDYNLGFPGTYYVESFCVMGSTLFCGTITNGLWKRQLTNSLSIPTIEEPVFFIIPNPNNGTFQISLPNGNETVFITNSLGQEIYRATANNKYTSIDLDVQNGLYFVNILTDKGILNRKVIIKK